MYKTVNERIKERRKELGLTLKQVAEALGVAEATVSRYESNDIMNMGIDKLEPLSKILKCSPVFLLVGNHTADSLQDLPAGAVAVAKRKVPLIRADASCGSGVPSCDDTEVEKLISIDNDIDVDYAIYAHGDSMEGARIYDGDIVFVKKCNAEQLIDGEIGLFQIENETLIKRIRRDTKNHIIWLYAENSKYTPEPITGERLENLKVLGKCIILQALLK